MPIGGLYKSQVRGLARHLGIPERIADKASSPRLWPEQMAEKELGLNFDEIDFLLHLIVDRRLSFDSALKEAGEQRRADIEKAFRRLEENSHKLRTPPVAKILTRAVLK